MSTWPTVARIREARLRIVPPTYGAEGALHKRGLYGTKVAEHWAGEIVLAPMSRSDALVMDAWRAERRGKLRPFLVPAAAGFLTSSGITLNAGTITTATTVGSATLAAALPTGQLLPAGTLLSVGDPSTDAFQTVELLAPVTTTGSAQTLTVAPRVRHQFIVGSRVTLNAVFRFRLVDDAGAFGQFAVGRGASYSLQVVEAVSARAPRLPLMDDDDTTALMDDDDTTPFWDDY